MGRKKKVVAFSPVEDFYLTGNAATKKTAELAEALGRPTEEVAERLSQLGIDASALAKQSKLSGTEVYSGASGKRVDGATSMTAGRVATDDEIAKRNAEGGKEFIAKRLKNSVAPVFAD